MIRVPDHPSNFKWHYAQEWHQWRTSLTGHTLSKRKNCRRVYSAELSDIVCRLSSVFSFGNLWQSWSSLSESTQRFSQAAESPNVQLLVSMLKPQKPNCRSDERTYLLAQVTMIHIYDNLFKKETSKATLPQELLCNDE